MALASLVCALSGAHHAMGILNSQSISESSVFMQQGVGLDIVVSVSPE